ncbi:hypothetical protein CKM354_000769800 [Cercospora kikuchii]|uniref:Uncharacterized protein n=1 Tax=Cercospora kikuchii TaxID=84275 RepID=A0A9P3CKQ1_9PEZI|nr:uncharacterized protein CKM354_000769800 [Cercospora kikuchii]GIZ44501.1 hypothetical protein CKM354_000769800 [Cercospora kikuchii]
MPPKSKRSNATMACDPNSSSNSHSNTNALEARRHFIVGLVEYAPLYHPPLCNTARHSMESSMFNPFAYVFLASAPEQTISLLAKVCIEARWVPTLLKIPPELRLKIYGFAFEDHWEESTKSPMFSLHLCNVLGERWNGAPPKRDDIIRYPLEPLILRTCKLFRKEGIEEYKNFLEKAFDVRHMGNVWDEVFELMVMRAEYHRLTFPGLPPSVRALKASARDITGRWAHTSAKRSAENAKAELQRMQWIEQRAIRGGGVRGR